jgi:hypothetical protein
MSEQEMARAPDLVPFPGWPCLVISGHGNYAEDSPWGVFLGPASSGGGCLPVIAASRVR